jgi:hypothetical protein
MHLEEVMNAIEFGKELYEKHNREWVKYGIDMKLLSYVHEDFIKHLHDGNKNGDKTSKTR